MRRVRDELRRATSAVHEALEREVDAIRRLSGEPDRSRLVAGYRRFHAAADAALWPFHDQLPGRSFGRYQPNEAEEPVGGRPESFAEALGYCYVVCGSALGGEIILRTLAARGADTAGLEFLVDSSYAAPGMWPALLDLLEKEVSDEAGRKASTRGAFKAFASARFFLSQSA